MIRVLISIILMLMLSSCPDFFGKKEEQEEISLFEDSDFQTYKDICNVHEGDPRHLLLSKANQLIYGPIEKISALVTTLETPERPHISEWYVNLKNDFQIFFDTHNTKEMDPIVMENDFVALCKQNEFRVYAFVMLSESYEQKNKPLPVGKYQRFFDQYCEVENNEPWQTMMDRSYVLAHIPLLGIGGQISDTDKKRQFNTIHMQFEMFQEFHDQKQDDGKAEKDFSELCKANTGKLGSFL